MSRWPYYDVMLHTCIMELRKPRWLCDALVNTRGGTVRTQVYRHLRHVLSMVLVGTELLEIVHALPRSRETFLHLHCQTLQATQIESTPENLWYLYAYVHQCYHNISHEDESWSIPHFFTEVHQILLNYAPEEEAMRPVVMLPWHTQVRTFLRARFQHAFCGSGGALDYAPSLFIGQSHFAVPRTTDEAYAMYTCMSHCERECSLYVWWFECYMDGRHDPDMCKGIKWGERSGRRFTPMWETTWRTITATCTVAHTYAIFTRLAYHVLTSTYHTQTMSDLCTVVDFLPMACPWWVTEIMLPLYNASIDRTQAVTTQYLEEIATTLCAQVSSDQRTRYLEDLRFSDPQINQIVRRCVITTEFVSCISAVLHDVVFPL